MNFFLECKKAKRTGLVPAFLIGGLLAALIPVLNMAVRSEVFLQLAVPPVQILLDANWQMMAMLNILLIASGACILYHTEYGGNAIQRMCTLPKKESGLFFGKFLVMAAVCLAALVLEAAGIAFCTGHWFSPEHYFLPDIVKNAGYSFILLFPSILSALWIASACKNMWISLGISVICIFIACVLPTNHFAFSLFPFAMPFQVFAGTAKSTVVHYLIAALAESVYLAILEILFLKVRRSLQ